MDSRLGSTSPLSPALSHPLLLYLPRDFCGLSTPLALLPPPLDPLFSSSHGLALGHGRRLSRINPRPSMASVWNRAWFPRYARPFCLSPNRHMVRHSALGTQRWTTPLNFSLYPRSTLRHRPQPFLPAIHPPNYRNSTATFPFLPHTPPPLRRHLLCSLSCLATPPPTLRHT